MNLVILGNGKPAAIEAQRLQINKWEHWVTKFLWLLVVAVYTLRVDMNLLISRVEKHFPQESSHKNKAECHVYAGF